MKKADNFTPGNWLIENKLTSQSKLLKENLGPDGFDTFSWNDTPTNPDAQLEDLENGGTMSKGEFWRSDITGRDPEYSTPSYGGEDNGVWTFSWDSGEVSGFIEGEDFTF